MLASVSELGSLSTTQVWSYHSNLWAIGATNLLHLRSYLTTSRVRSMHFALWLMAVSIFDHLSSPGVPVALGVLLLWAGFDWDLIVGFDPAVTTFGNPAPSPEHPLPAIAVSLWVTRGVTLKVFAFWHPWFVVGWMGLLWIPKSQGLCSFLCCLVNLSVLNL